MKLSRVQVEESVSELVLNSVEGVYPTRVTCYRQEGVRGRWAEPTWCALNEVWCVVRGRLRYKLQVKLIDTALTDTSLNTIA